MAPIKFEEQIKDKLEKRTVTPSSEAWSKLSQRLDAEDNKTKKTSFWWIGIAASVAVLIMISVGVFSKTTESEIDDIIVKDVINKTSETDNTKTLIETKNLEKQQVAKEDTSEEIIDLKITQSKASDIITKKQQKQTPKKETVIAKVETLVVPKNALNTIVKQETAIANTEKPEFNSIIDELKEVKAKREVTDQTVDSLLKIANKELLMDKALKKNTNVVNADALLQDVEDAMGESFRSRIYETLKGGLKEVKKAVVQRHDN
ncbi:hypothetical protein ACFQ1Q_07385 [Winogradskyella litorisediminis]|uniref:Anti-sigma factor n=1 Tax=Winogradskyella litorisediminis TaxID=1156618 RepID=A0ABW3N9C7_9FLAO